jgi:two-component system cell cycle response regulator
MTAPTEYAMGYDRPGRACHRVLVAEDDAMFRRILRSWLESWGYTVSIAEDGEQAWLMLEREDAPQLLILDWIMPKISGLELCMRIRERSRAPYQYILLATAKDDTQDLVRGLEAGADDYLSKPFDKNELRARLRTGRRILTLQDEQLQARETLQFQATHDGLTGIWNRNAIFDLLHREFEVAARGRKKTGVIMLDLDHFKNVNDTHGHLAGDAVLREATRRIMASVRAYDLVGRFGGEEFLIVLPDCDKDQVWLCAERIRLGMEEQAFAVDGARIAVTASLGTAVVDPLMNTEREALAAADTALYAAKNGGRNRVIFLDVKYR